MNSMNPKRILLLCTLAFSALAMTAAESQAQVTPKTVTALTLSDTSIALSATEVVTSQAFTINPRSGFAVIPTFVCAASGTSNVTFNFEVSVDGTNWTTMKPFSAAIAATGTTPVTGFYNFPANVAGTGAANIAWVRLGSVQNANSGGAITLTSILISRDN